jgi:hypothetical protein
VSAWNELLAEFIQQPDPATKSAWLEAKGTATAQEIARLRNDRNVILYASAFLQKPQAPAPSTQITFEDINGFMSVMFGMDFTRPLTLIIHTPGGQTNAAETIVAYLRSKFADIEVVVPAYAMSAGTMISLASNRILMGRQSQLGPIDPQMPVGGRFVSARAVVEQFEQARSEITADTTVAHLWAPVLQSLGPSLLQEAKNALEYGERMVAGWMASYMFAGDPDPAARGAAAARHFNDASTHKSHGRRIDRDEARGQGLVVDDIEPDARLQDAVLTMYHVSTIVFEQSPTAKLLWSSSGRTWMKNWVPSTATVAP